MRFSLLSAAVAMTAAAGYAAAKVAKAEAIPGRYIIEIETPAQAATADIKASADKIDSVLASAGISTNNIKFKYGRVFPGAAVENLTPDDVERLSKVEGVKHITQVYRRKLELPTPLVVASPSAVNSARKIGRAFTDNPSPALNASIPETMKQVHTLTDAIVARDKYKVTGKGIKVGIIDTGIDYTHPDLGGCFGPGCRVAYGYNYITPDPKDVKDCYGHGTHVAGIVGAAGTTIAGIAPEVTFGAYRIGDCDATIAGDDVFVQAVERAVGDNMDIISVSIAQSGRFPWDPVSVAYKNAMKSGVIMVNCNANEEGRLWTATTPASVEGVIAVTAIDNLHKVVSVFTSNVAPDTMYPIDRFAGAANNDVFKNVKNAPLVVANIVADGTRCEVSNLADVAGKVVLFESYDAKCGPIASDKIDAAGPKAIIFYYDADKGSAQINTNTAAKSSVPYLQMWPTVAAPLKDALAKGTQVIITGAEGTHPANHPTAGQISWYASRGLAADLTLKPAIAAPGGAIWSTIPVAKGSYGSMGGTSMATPYISGLIALYLQKYNGSTPAEMHARLQSGARNVLPHYSQATFPGLDNPVSIGAGVVNATNFLNYAQSVFTPSQLSLNDTGRPDFKGTYVKTLTLRNNADYPVVFDFSHESAIATTFVEDYFNAPYGAQRFANASASVSFSPSTLSIPSDRSATVAVTITPPSNLNDADLFIYGGWIVATPRQPVPNGIAIARAPYAGVKGDYSRAPVLAKPPTFTQKFVGNTTDGTPIWDPFQDEFAKVSFDTKYASPHVDIAFIKADTNESVGWAAYYDNVPTWRTIEPALSEYVCDKSVFQWETAPSCKATNKPLPEGKYRLVARFQRPFTNPSAADSYYTHNSPVFYLKSSRNTAKPANGPN
ncbi:subtilisin-like protein [Ramicandelaber brevisporus]|nr:subtilisin-like protein [Ramicandelaber brevisporus]